jgi:hypothetical protein
MRLAVSTGKTGNLTSLLANRNMIGVWSGSRHSLATGGPAPA